MKPSPAALSAALEIINGEPFHKNDDERMLAWALIIDRHMRVMPLHPGPKFLAGGGGCASQEEE